MPRSLGRVVFAATMLCLTASLASAQSTSTSTETKSFEVISAAGNTVVVKLPEGTREMTVPESFRFKVDGQELTAQELKPGMTGTATITTRTITTPVTVTEIRKGTVAAVSGSNLYVRTDDGVKMFSQSEIDKRGVRIMREGKPAELSEFRPNDEISATIVTTHPPTVVTEREVEAILDRTAAAATPTAIPADLTSAASAAASAAPSAPPEAVGTTGTLPETLPATAGPLPLIGLVGLTSLGLAAGLMLYRRRP